MYHTNTLQNLSEAVVKLLDHCGNTLYVSQNINAQIPVSGLPKGEYILCVKSENGEQRQKLLISE